MNIQIGHDAALVESKKKLISGTYMRNAWYVAAWSEAIGDGGVLGLTILKEPVVLYRQDNGEVAALARSYSQASDRLHPHVGVRVGS